MANAFISLEEILQSLSAADFTVPILCLDSFQSPPEELTPPECYQTPGHPPGTLSAFDDTALKGRRGTALALSAAPGTLAPPPSPGQPGPFAAALIGKLVGGASLGEALHTLPFEVANIDGEQARATCATCGSQNLTQTHALSGVAGTQQLKTHAPPRPSRRRLS